MPQPDVRSTIVRGPLQNASISYRNMEYIADRVAPILDNVSPRTKITKYNKGAWFRDEAGIRAPGSRAPRGGYGITFVNITTNEYSFAKEVNDKDRRDAKFSNSPPLQLDQEAIEFATDKIDLNKEIRLANLILNDTTWSGGSEDAEGGWAASGSNTFLTDVRARIKTIHSSTGIRPNSLVIDFGTWNSLLEESTLLDKIKHTQTGVVTQDLVASFLGLERLLIGSAVKNTAKEAADGTDATMRYVWEKNSGKGSAFLFYAPMRPGLRKPSALYQARTPINGSAREIRRYREEAERQDVYEVNEETDMIATATDLGFLWTDTLTT